METTNEIAHTQKRPYKNTSTGNPLTGKSGDVPEKKTKLSIIIDGASDTTNSENSSNLTVVSMQDSNTPDARKLYNNAKEKIIDLCSDAEENSKTDKPIKNDKKVAKAKSKKLKLKIEQKKFAKHGLGYQRKLADMSNFIPIKLSHKVDDNVKNDKLLLEHQMENVNSCHIQRLQHLVKDKNAFKEISQQLKSVCGYFCGFDDDGTRREVFECDYCLSLWHVKCMPFYKVEVFVNLKMIICKNCAIIQDQVLHAKTPSIFCNTDNLFEIEYQPDTRPITSIEPIYKLCKLQWIENYLKAQQTLNTTTSTNTVNTNNTPSISLNNSSIDTNISTNNITSNATTQKTTSTNYRWLKSYTFSIKKKMIQRETDHEIIKLKYQQDEIRLLAEIFSDPSCYLMYNKQSYPVIQNRVVVNNAELHVPITVGSDRILPCAKASFFLLDSNQPLNLHSRNMQILSESMKASLTRANNLNQQTTTLSSQMPQLQTGQIQLAMPSTTVNPLVNPPMVTPTTTPILNLTNAPGPRFNIITSPVLTGMWPSTGPSIMASVTFNQQQPQQITQQLNSSTIPEITNVQSLSVQPIKAPSAPVNIKALSYLRNYIFASSNLPYTVLKKILTDPILNINDHKNIRMVNRMFREIINSIYYNKRHILIPQKPTVDEKSNIIDYMEIEDDEPDNSQSSNIATQVPIEILSTVPSDCIGKFEYVIEYSSDNSIQNFNRLVKNKERNGKSSSILQLSIIIRDLPDNEEPRNYLNGLNLNAIFKSFKRTKKFQLTNLSDHRLFMKMLHEEKIQAKELQKFTISGISNERDLKFDHTMTPNLIKIVTDDNKMISKYLATYPYLFLTNCDVKLEGADANELAMLLSGNNKITMEVDCTE